MIENKSITGRTIYSEKELIVDNKIGRIAFIVLNSQSSGWQAKLDSFSYFEHKGKKYPIMLSAHIPLEVVDGEPVYSTQVDSTEFYIRSDDNELSVTYYDDTQFFITQVRPTSKTTWSVEIQDCEDGSAIVWVAKLVYRDPQGDVLSYRKTLCRHYKTDGLLEIKQTDFQKY